MATFKDAEGREWRVGITVGDLKPVREATGVKLGSLFDEKMAGLQALVKDPEKVVDVVWLLVKGQHPGVTAEQFGRGLGGDGYEDAVEALYRAAVDFSPRQGRRPLLAILTKTAEVQGRAAAVMEAQIDAMSLSTLNASAGSSPASSESTPAP